MIGGLTLRLSSERACDLPPEQVRDALIDTATLGPWCQQQSGAGTGAPIQQQKPSPRATEAVQRSYDQPPAIHGSRPGTIHYSRLAL